MDDDGSSQYGGSVAGGGTNDSFQNSISGGDLSLTGDDETTDILRGVFGDDYINEIEVQNQLFQVQHAAGRPVEARIQGENEEDRRVQEVQTSMSFLPHSRFGEQQQQQHPRRNSDLYEAPSTLSFGHQIRQGRNDLAHMMMQQQQYYRSQPTAQGYHQGGPGIPPDSRPSIGSDGGVVEQHQQHQQYLHHEQMLARQVIQNRMAQHPQQQQMLMRLPQPETLYDHKMPQSSGQKHPYSSEVGSSIVDLSNHDNSPSLEFEAAKKQRRLDKSDDGQGPPQRQDPAAMSYTARNQNMPKWMNAVAGQQQYQTVGPPSASVYKPPVAAYGRSIPPLTRQYKPIIREIPEHHIPTWELPLPLGVYKMATGPRRFELSLVNVKEFTITGLPPGHDKPPSSLDGLRKKIKEISKDHGVAVYERGKEGGPGKWRIPLVRFV